MVTIARTNSVFSALSAWLSGLFGGSRRTRTPAAPVRGGQPSEAEERAARGKRNNDRMAMQTLESGLKSGRITPEEYAARIARLSDTPAP